MLVESLLASLMLMGGCTTSAMSFEDIDSYHDAIAEAAVSNMDGDGTISSDQYTRINDSLSVTGLQKVIIQNVSWKHDEFSSHAAEDDSPYLNSIFTHIPH